MRDETRPERPLREELDVLRERERNLQRFCNLFLEDEPVQRTGGLEGAVLDHIERRYLSIFTNAPIGIFQCDREGGLLNVNYKLAEMCGYNDEDALLDNVAGLGDIFAGPLPAEGLMESFIADNQHQGLEIKALRKDNSDFWARLYVAATPDEEGKILYWDGFVIDIDSQKRAEQSRENVEHIIRHDMKTPLIGAAGLARSLLKRDELQGRGREMAEMILEQTSKAIDMLQQSLDLYRMEQGVYTPEETRVDLRELLQRVKASLQTLAQDAGVSITLEASDYAPTVQGSDQHLETLFTNLVKNGLEAAPEGSSVYIGLQPDPNNPDAAQVEVHNQGVIPREIRPVFFEQFSTSGKKGGAGLGAYSARLIARAHNGDIHFTTHPSHGSSLYVTLPTA